MSENVSQSGHQSARYTHGHGAAALAAHGARTAANSAAYLLPHLRCEHSVLDVGCGPGSITLDLAEQVDRVVGLENSDTALTAAAAAIADRGVDNVELVTGDVHALDFDDDSFDVAHAHQVLQHVSDPVQALREMARVSRGIVAVRDVDFGSMVWFPRLPALDLWRDAYMEMARANGGEPQAARHLRSWANAAGLTDQQHSASVWHYADASGARWWGGNWAERCAQSSYAEQARGVGVNDAELAEIVAAWTGWAEHPDAWLAMTHGELLAGGS